MVLAETFAGAVALHLLAEALQAYSVKEEGNEVLFIFDSQEAAEDATMMAWVHPAVQRQPDIEQEGGRFYFRVPRQTAEAMLDVLDKASDWQRRRV